MNRKRQLPLLAVLLAGLTCSCSSGSGLASALHQNTEICAADAPVDRSLMDLKDGDYAMSVEQKLVETDDIQLPRDVIPPQNYGPSDQKGTVSIRISKNGSEVRFSGANVVAGVPDVAGRLEATSPGKNIYELTGLFAGGQFTIEKTGRGMVATFTTFGSGRPVLSSARGPLIPVKAK